LHDRCKMFAGRVSVPDQRFDFLCDYFKPPRYDFVCGKFFTQPIVSRYCHCDVLAYVVHAATVKYF